MFKSLKRLLKGKSYRTIETEKVKLTVQEQLDKLGYIYSLEEPTKRAKYDKGSLLQRLTQTKIFPREKHILIYTIDNMPHTIGGSEVKPRIIVRNSYDKSCSFFIGIGFYRLVCTNGLMVGEDYFKDRIIHVKGPKIEQFFKTLPERINFACQAIGGVVQKLDDLSKVPIDLEKAKNIVNNLEVLSNRSKTKLVQKLELHEKGERVFRPLDNPSNLWSLYNIINEDIRKTSKSTEGNFNKNVNLLANIEKLAA